MDIETIRYRLVSSLTQYDISQQKRRGYNPYALAIYLRAVDSILDDYKSGKSLEQAICESFCDRVLDVALKAVAQ